MSKKILILAGSPRKNGNTDRLADAFIRGAMENEHTVEKIYLRDEKINGCLGCLACQRNGGTCVQSDDMDGLYDKMLQVDIIVLVAPVYFYSFNAQMKTVLDRTIALHQKEFQNKTFYLLSAGQAPEEKYMKTMIDNYQQYLSCFPNMKDGGFIFAYNTSDPSDVENNPVKVQAYELGKAIL